MISGATISECKKYRYNLYRVWDESKSLLAFCMLNPSTADEVENDPTIERCCRRAKMAGMGGIIVVNVFAYRSTDPKELYNVADPVGPDNDMHIKKAARRCGVVVCGWGKHGSLNQRSHDVISLIRYEDALPLALKINKDGSPRHPLYIGYDASLVDLVTGEPYVSEVKHVPSL